MFRIQVRQQFLDKRVFYGDPVENLSDTHDLLVKLEADWHEWESRGFPPLPDNNAVKYLEGSEIYVIADDGRVYWLNAENGFDIMN